MGYGSVSDTIVFTIILVLVGVLAFLGSQWLLIELRAKWLSRGANKGISKRYADEKEGRL